MMGYPKTVVVLAGPTAVGKTTAAIRLAQHLDTHIISADSRQCFRELNIGVARPSREELALVPHHFIASHSIHEKVTAAVFEQYALEKLEHLFRERDVVVMAGGTGLYLKAFSEGMDGIPEIPETIHEALVIQYEKEGIDWLRQQLKENDPLYFQKGEIKNPQRMMRALEVWRATGRSITTFQKGTKRERPFRILKFGLSVPREQLHRNIENRVDRMIASGLVEEAAALLDYRHLNALQTVGYKEVFDYLNGVISLDDSISAIKTNTRRYAKRQMTWFRKDAQMLWLGEWNLQVVVDKIREAP